MSFYKKSENIKKLREIVNALDIKEATNKQVDDMFATIREVCKDGYWDWRIDENYKFLSPTLKAQMGYSDEEIENVPGAAKKIMVKDDIPNLVSELDKHFNTKGEYPFRVVVRYIHKNGNIIKILCRGTVVEWGENNEPLRMVGSHVDITNL